MGRDDLVDFMLTLRDAARSRETFDRPAIDGRGRRACRLSKGDDRRGKLICFPAPLALCGPQQFARFAKPFRGSREVSVLTMPGFVGKEALPISLDVAIEDHVAAIQRVVDESGPPVLAGYSSGGVFAYGVAGHLESIGKPVRAVILLDSYPPGPAGVSDQGEAMMVKLLTSPEFRPLLNDTRLTAMAQYTEWVMNWELAEVQAPTLAVVAAKPLFEVVGDTAWQPSWPFDREIVEIDSDHFDLMQEHAVEAAGAVERWLETVEGSS